MSVGLDNFNSNSALRCKRMPSDIQMSATGAI